MNYQQLHELLLSPLAYGENDSAQIFAMFSKKYPQVIQDKQKLFVFSSDRDFAHRNHKIELHSRSNGAIPLHIYHYIVITYIYSGNFSMTVNGVPVSLECGDLIILEKYVPHSVAPTSPDDLGINIILTDDFFIENFSNQLPKHHHISRLVSDVINRQYFHNHFLCYATNQDESIRHTIDDILCEQFDPQLCTDEVIDNLISILITRLTRLHSLNSNLSIDPTKSRLLLEEILNYIRTQYAEGSLTQMCQALNYNQAYVSNFISSYTGKSFKTLVMEQRIRKASILLQNSDLTIQQIAAQVGMSNLTSFYKKFRLITGFSPRAFRNLNDEIPLPRSPKKND